MLDAGALAVEVSDPNEGALGEVPVYAEPGEPGATLWPISRIAALFDESEDVDAACSRAAATIARSLPVWEARAVADEDWVRATQKQFGPIRVADSLWIVPSWCVPPDPGARNLILDPGLAFGTGSHPTTRLCLEWLHENLAGGETLLDYGCGSGILAIAAAKLGAREVSGTDIDPQALMASKANAIANGVVASFAAPDALAAATYDVVIANILTNPLLLLAPALAARVRGGGRIALTGILATQAGAVIGAYERWFRIAPWRAADGWTLLAGTRLDDIRGAP